MINRFRQIEDHINGEVQSLTKNVNEANRHLNEIEMTLVTEQNLHSIEYVLRSLQQHVDEILDSIQLAKQGYISHYLLTKEESNFIYDNLEQQKIEINSEHELYQFLQIKTYFKHPMIVFSIIIPQYSKDIFQHIKLYPLTVNQTYTIKIPSKFIHTHQKIAKYSNEPCDKIDNTYFCNKEEIYEAQDKCIEHIVTNQPAQCTLTEGKTINYIQQIEQKFIIVNVNETLEYRTDCTNQTSKNLPRQCLITFQNCTITIKGITYNNLHREYQGTYSYVPFNEIIITNTTKVLDPEIITNIAIDNMNKLNYVERISLPQTHHYTAWSITSIIAISIIMYLCILRYCPSCTPCQWYGKIKQSPDIKDLSRKLQKTNSTEDSENLEMEELHPIPFNNIPTTTSQYAKIFPDLKAYNKQESINDHKN